MSQKAIIEALTSDIEFRVFHKDCQKYLETASRDNLAQSVGKIYLGTLNCTHFSINVKWSGNQNNNLLTGPWANGKMLQVF